MTICGLYMPPRKPKTFKLDERLIEALERLAIAAGESTGSYVEQVLWRHCQGAGAIGLTEQPAKDQRGGKRPNAGRKPKDDSDEDPS